MKEAFSTGAHFFLSKPLDLAKLRHLVRSIHGTLLRERSRNRRVPLAVQVSCRIGPRSCTGLTSQISEQGVVFRLLFSPEITLLPGQIVHVSFPLPTSLCAVETMVVIVRTDGHHTVCQFQKLGDLARQAVQEFVASFRDGAPEVSLEKKATAA
jgi:hypothetical protein